MDWVLDKKDKYSMTEKDESNGKVVKEHDQYALTGEDRSHTRTDKGEAEYQDANASAISERQEHGILHFIF